MFERLNGLRENAEPAISCTGPGPATKKKRYCIPVVGRKRKMHRQICLCGKAGERRTHTVGQCQIHKEEGDVLGEETRKIGECDIPGRED